MTVARARTRSGARTGVRIAICGATALLALFATACGNTTVDLGTPVLTLTDTSGDFTSYIVYIDNIQATRTDNSVQSLLTTQERVDLAQLSNVVELLQAPAAITGSYVSVTFTIDYTNASITVNNNGQSVPVTLVDTAGAIPAAITYTVKFDPAHPMVITKGQSTQLAMDFDLAASNSINLNTSPATVTVKPLMVVNAQPVYNKPIRARGLFVDADTTAGTFSLNTRPLQDVTGITYGALHVSTDASTYYNLDGVTYAGAAGLAAVAKLRQNVQIGVVGGPTAIKDLTGITPVFAATAVYAGTSLESLIAERISGVVAGRVGDTLSLRNASVVTRAGGVFFAASATATLGTSTIVSQDGVVPATPLDKQAVSVGQHIEIFGNVPLDSAGTPVSPVTLDATVTLAQVRLQPTTLWGSVNSVAAGSLSASLLSLDNLEATQFSFAGTGTSGMDATAATYAVNTGSIDLSSLAPPALVKIDGFASPFGSAPPDFNATAVTAGTSADSQLIVEWNNGGTTAPFTSQSATGIVIDTGNGNLAGTYHVIRTGPTAVDILTKPGMVITTTNPNFVNQSAIVLGVGNVATGMSTFNSAAAFSTQLQTTLNGTTRVNKLVAVGRYDSSSNTFNASSIDINVQ
ncbi:MAG: hypothetical protein JWM63_1759 [Gammaproteobacteria bacterium]|nr:hypothetical protein [Gammaproteobacteria bacterium]